MRKYSLALRIIKWTYPLLNPVAENLNFLLISHAKEEMLYDEYGVISEQEVKEAIEAGEVIEEYLKDRPYPSFLVFGKTLLGRPLHIVCAPIEPEKTLVIITVYQPDPNLWIDYRRRKR